MWTLHVAYVPKKRCYTVDILANMLTCSREFVSCLEKMNFAGSESVAVKDLIEFQTRASAVGLIPTLWVGESNRLQMFRLIPLQTRRCY